MLLMLGRAPREGLTVQIDGNPGESSFSINLRRDVCFSCKSSISFSFA